MVGFQRLKQKRRAGDPGLAVVYLRVSTEKEEQDAGLVSQRERCETWALSHGVTKIAEHLDRLSGGTPADERPGLLAALDELREHGAGLLLVADRSRLARDVVIAATIESLVRSAGGRVVSADGVSAEDTPEGQLIRTIMDSFAQYQRALIRARTAAALRRKRERGELVGGVPYGWRRNGNGGLGEVAAEQATIRKIATLRASGLGARRIARLLNEWGGSTWHPRTVARILARGNRQ